MKRFALLFLLASPPALAADIFLGTLVASGGTTVNNSGTSNVKADGTTGAWTLPTSRPLKLAIQCDVAARYRTGTSNTTAAANSGANKGPKLDVDQLYLFTLQPGHSYIAVIPASGSGAANCDVYRRTE
jgi:hypothetical protein